ncbi:hypothetical protein IGI04_001328 [Brassica rapa subsp. trilocularis]|uniref:Replication factor A C-terminal domain-containing protein n=1 Tax=Brassica rapa subsp. trilocularis TaxID=1813537 RepID=A0ABQ7NSB9_BRACM|nr:hypothetical protein IGI04_001328 [Brassica rapa subsp. trilocularis]
MAMKRNGKSLASSGSDEEVMLFKDVSLGPHETQLRFRLIHFWEARNPVKKTLIGLEMLLIDEQGTVSFVSVLLLRVLFFLRFHSDSHFTGTVIQGFIPPGRIKKYLPDMKRGSVYKLINFYGSKNKPSFISLLTYSFHENVIDVVGHMKLVDGQTLLARPSLDDVKIATARHIMIHVQSHDGPVMKLYLWDQAAADFCKKFNSSKSIPTVLLVTTVNTKRLGGTLALASMSSTRVFMDYDVQPTRDYFSWLSSNPEIANQVIADVITKRETLTIADVFSYMTQESAKDAFFECTATIDDVVHGSSWYYIACSECHSKATKGPSSLICTNTKCEKVNTVGIPQYRAKISVYDKTEQAFFVLLGDAGRELTGRHASELVNSYFEVNKSEGADHVVPVPEALISTIGQTHKFCVKVTDHNFSGNTRAITVTKILPLDTPPPTEASVGNDIATTSEEAMQSGNDVCEHPKSRGDSLDEESKRTCTRADPETAKRPRCEN